MSTWKLERQSDIEDLSAWMDGELADADARRVARLVETDPAWTDAHRELKALDDALEAMPTPAPQRPLTEKIVRAATRRRTRVRFIKFAAPLAAAAAIILAVLAANYFEPKTPTGIEGYIHRRLAAVEKADRMLVANLQMFSADVDDYSAVRDVADADTLAALASLEAGEGL